VEDVAGWGRTEKRGLEKENEVGEEEINRLNYNHMQFSHIF
jgi:hypothetical protein